MEVPGRLAERWRLERDIRDARSGTFSPGNRSGTVPVPQPPAAEPEEGGVPAPAGTLSKRASAPERASTTHRRPLLAGGHPPVPQLKPSPLRHANPEWFQSQDAAPDWERLHQEGQPQSSARGCGHSRGRCGPGSDEDDTGPFPRPDLSLPRWPPEGLDALHVAPDGPTSRGSPRFPRRHRRRWPPGRAAPASRPRTRLGPRPCRAPPREPRRRRSGAS